jgi:hypothetical protein
MMVYVVINISDHNGISNDAQIEGIFLSIQKANKSINGIEVNYNIEEHEVIE